MNVGIYYQYIVIFFLKKKALEKRRKEKKRKKTLGPVGRWMVVTYGGDWKLNNCTI